MLEQRRKLREDSRRLIQEEVEKMEKDLAQEQVRSIPHITPLVIHLSSVADSVCIYAETQQFN